MKKERLVQWRSLHKRGMLELTLQELQIRVYFDGIVLICKRYEDALYDRIQTGLGITSNRPRKMRLCINPAKVNIIPFTRKCKVDHLKVIRYMLEIYFEKPQRL